MSMSLEYGPSSEPLHIPVKQFFLNCLNAKQVVDEDARSSAGDGTSHSSTTKPSKPYNFAVIHCFIFVVFTCTVFHWFLFVVFSLGGGGSIWFYWSCT